jgi:hypothetical protein
VGDAPTGHWWDGERVEGLPCYLQERRPRVTRTVVAPLGHDDRARLAAPWAWLAGSAGFTEWAAPTMIISRVIELPPARAVAAFEEWWAACPAPAVIVVGGDRLVLRSSDAIGGALCLRRVTAALHLGRRRRVRLELDVAAWSASQTEFDLRPDEPLSGYGRRRRYFAVGQDLIDRLADEVLAVAAGTGPLPSAV